MSVRYTAWGHPGVVLAALLALTVCCVAALGVIGWVAVYGGVSL